MSDNNNNNQQNLPVQFKSFDDMDFLSFNLLKGIFEFHLYY